MGSCNNMFRLLEEDGDAESGAPAKPDPPTRLRPGRSFATVAATPPVPSAAPLPPPAVVVGAPSPAVRGRRATTHTTRWGLETFDPSNYVRRAAAHSVFYGTCYTCLYPNHSQKFCPLRRCKCGRWGHTDQVCPGIK